MDAFFFSMKRAHLGVERLGRGFLKEFELTPARFDLVNTIADCEDEDDEPMTQAELWKRLGVVRSAVCEMVKELVRVGVIVRERVPGERTWFVKLTELGRRLRWAAYDALINKGIATQWADSLITMRSERDPMPERYMWTQIFFAMGHDLGNWVRRNTYLYTWDIEDLYGWLIPLEENEDVWTWGDVPLMDDAWIAQNTVEMVAPFFGEANRAIS
jgi:DNA-binding MarR family transcriptional regulator